MTYKGEGFLHSNAGTLFLLMHLGRVRSTPWSNFWLDILFGLNPFIAKCWVPCERFPEPSSQLTTHLKSKLHKSSLPFVNIWTFKKNVFPEWRKYNVHPLGSVLVSYQLIYCSSHTSIAPSKRNAQHFVRVMHLILHLLSALGSQHCSSLFLPHHQLVIMKPQSLAHRQIINAQTDH